MTTLPSPWRWATPWGAVALLVVGACAGGDEGAGSGPAGCLSGYTDCAGRCADLRSSPTDCGACGATCAAGLVCASGACAATCLPTQTNCSGACVDLTADAGNCGACGDACLLGQVCSGAQCVGDPLATGGSTGSGGTSSGGSSSGGGTGTGGAGGTCTDTPPPPDAEGVEYTCAQQVGWGKCGEAWMAGYCDESCGRCSAAATGGSAGTGGTTGTGGAGTGRTCSTVGGGQCPATFTCPSGSTPSSSTCGCYTPAGLGANKAALFAAGARDYMLASAMMETELMDASTYPYGDQMPDGTPKTGDAWNGGVCKQNWGMMRTCYPPWQGLASDQYATAGAMNSDLGLDVAVYNACRDHFGDDWWAGHRNGASGLANPDTADIQAFKAAMDWTYEQLVSGSHFCDDVRFWVNVQAIVIE